MIDVLAGAKKIAEADSVLMAMFPAGFKIYLDQVTEASTSFPRAVVRHVQTTWKYTMPSKIDAKRLRDDQTTFKFEIIGDDLPLLNRIQQRLRVIFESKAFSLIGHDGNQVSTTDARMTACLEAPGGTIQSLPQPNMTQLSIHRLDQRFRCEVSRYF